MGYAEPLQALIEEHRVLGVVLNALDLETQSLHGQPFPIDPFKQAVDLLSPISQGKSMVMSSHSETADQGSVLRLCRHNMTSRVSEHFF